MSDPLLFISHKHADGPIALALASFIEARSGGRVRVHLSSSPDFQGPRFGKGLNEQLRTALWQTEVLILVYTSADQDWSYCMWECGVATHPQSPNSKIIVFQCGSDAPSPFASELRVNARNYEDIKRFTTQFLRDPQFFPNLGGAIAPNLRDALVDAAAQELHLTIGSVLPPPSDGLVEEWSAWPYLRIELPRPEVSKLEQASETERNRLAHDVVLEHGVVIDSDARAAQLFGLAGLPQKQKFSVLLSLWKEKYPGVEATWFSSCCEQIVMGARRGFPVIRWTPMREVGGDSEYTPVLSRIRRVPFAGSIHFDLNFYNLADPRAVPVASRMIPKSDCFYETLATINPTTLKLKDIVADLEKRKLNRMPIFNAEGHPLYIVHRSMVDKFIVTRVLSGQGDPGALTLADLLGDAEMRQMFESTFAVVSQNASLAEAKTTMVAKPGCSDIFVTEQGGRNEPFVGWLTNVDITRE